MKMILFTFFLLFASVSYCQVSVNAGNMKEHIGDSVKYCGAVMSARFMSKMNNTPSFLNIDGAYPNQVFTVVIWKQDRDNFRNEPEKFYLNKNVCVYGRVEKFREQLQIVIHSESQIIISE